MTGRLEDKVCLITGAASGIGRASAQLFAAQGARLALVDRAGEAVLALAGELEEDATQVMAEALDVTDRPAVEALVDRVVGWAGRLDVVVNSAGITRRNVDEDADFEDAWDQVMEVNLKGTLLVCHAAVAAMRASGGGSIINLGSIMSTVVYPNGSGLSDGFNPYTHSKGGVLQLTRDLGVQLAGEGIRVNAVCPGFVRTSLTERISQSNVLHEKACELTPMGRFAEPEEIASVIAFLASDEASYVTAVGWPVDGGYTAR